MPHSIIVNLAHPIRFFRLDDELQETLRRALPDETIHFTNHTEEGFLSCVNACLL